MGLEGLIIDLPEGVRFYLDDNYIHLLPDEECTIQASTEVTERAELSDKLTLTFQTDGWNVERKSINLQIQIID